MKGKGSGGRLYPRPHPLSGMASSQSQHELTEDKTATETPRHRDSLCLTEPARACRGSISHGDTETQRFSVSPCLCGLCSLCSLIPLCRLLGRNLSGT